MKTRMAVLLFALISTTAFAQNRNVIVSWGASPTTGVTYNLFSCSVATLVATCTPSTAVNTAPITGTTYTVSETVGLAYFYSVVAVGPACTSTTPLTTPCGNSAATVSAIVPVPPLTQGVPSITVLVN